MSIANFTVNLSESSTDEITVAYTTVDGTAVAGTNYTANSGTLTFAAGETSKTITVALSDTTPSSDVVFYVALSSPTNAELSDTYQGSVTIPGATVITVLTGTYLFLLDSLTAGPGSVVPVPYYIASTAAAAGRLRYMWNRPILATTYSSNTQITYSGSTVSQGSSFYCPSQACVYIDGTSSTEVVTFTSHYFPWVTMRVYFQKISGGGSFDITAPDGTTTTVSMDGTTGDIGYVDLDNSSLYSTDDIASGLTTTANYTFTITNFTGECYITGYRSLVQDLSSDYLDVYNWALSSQTTEAYNAVTNITDWYTEAAIDHAVINTGTNDASAGYTATLAQFETLMENLVTTYGCSASNIVIMRPNDPESHSSKILGDLWEDIRDKYNTQFTSIVRLYGVYSTMEANGYMSDETHPNSTFNAIQAAAEYGYTDGEMTLVYNHAQLDLGSYPHWRSTFATTTYILLDSTVSSTDDLTIEVRFRKGNSGYAQYLFSENTSAYATHAYINTSNQLVVKIGGGTSYTSTETVTAWNYYTLRLTIDRTNSELKAVMYDYEGNATTFLDQTSASMGTTTSILTFGRWYGGIGQDTGGIYWCKFGDSHSWEFDQGFEVETVEDDIGSVSGTWTSRNETYSTVVKYSVMSDGTQLDYHYGVAYTSSYYWGDPTIETNQYPSDR